MCLLRGSPSLWRAAQTASDRRRGEVLDVVPRLQEYRGDSDQQLVLDQRSEEHGIRTNTTAAVATRTISSELSRHLDVHTR